MAKYFVQSGTLRSVVEAESSRRAALWAIHQAMQQVLPLDAGPSTASTDETQSHCEPVRAVLSGRLRVSSSGFDHSDATQLETLEVVNEWNQMVLTLDRLEKMLYRAA